MPASAKISKLRACFMKWSKYGEKTSRYQLVQFELYDENDELLWRCGKNKGLHSNWEETKIPSDETLIGFKVVFLTQQVALGGLGFVTAKRQHE